MRTDYEMLATDYARHRHIHPGVLQGLVEGGALNSECRALEVGCGTGNFMKAIHDATGCFVTGIDPSAAMLTVAQQQNPMAPLHQTDGETLAIEETGFDLVYSVDVIHHIKDLPAYFRAAFGKLRPGGKIVTVTDSAEDIRRRIPLSTYFPATVQIELGRYPAINLLYEEMTAAGFSAIEETHTQFSYDLESADSFRDRVYSSLQLLDDDEFEAGLHRLANDLAVGSIHAMSLYTLVWGIRPPN